MRKKFYICDFIQKIDNQPLYYMGYTSTNGSWTPNTGSAMQFDTEQEAIWKLEQLIKEEGSQYELITVYS